MSEVLLSSTPLTQFGLNNTALSYHNQLLFVYGKGPIRNRRLSDHSKPEHFFMGSIVKIVVRLNYLIDGLLSLFPIINKRLYQRWPRIRSGPGYPCFLCEFGADPYPVFLQEAYPDLNLALLPSPPQIIWRQNQHHIPRRPLLFT